MGCLKQHQEEDDNAKKVAGQRWWAIGSLGRQLKGKNPDEKEEGEKELEVILLSNRQPKVEQLGEAEVWGFTFVVSETFSGDMFYSSQGCGREKTMVVLPGLVQKQKQTGRRVATVSEEFENISEKIVQF